MNDELLALIGRELLGWPGVSKETYSGARARADLGSAGDRLLAWPQGDRTHPRRWRGADLVFPKEIHDGLISDGRARAAADDPNLVVPRIAM